MPSSRKAPTSPASEVVAITADLISAIDTPLRHPIPIVASLFVSVPVVTTGSAPVAAATSYASRLAHPHVRTRG